MYMYKESTCKYIYMVTYIINGLLKVYFSSMSGFLQSLFVLLYLSTSFTAIVVNLNAVITHSGPELQDISTSLYN